MPVDISVLLPTRNAGSGFVQVLDAIFHQRIDATFEVVIVDSGSTDGTLNVASAYPVQAHQIDPTSFGHGRTRNHLARLARGRVLVYLSQDATPIGERWLDELVQPLADPQVVGSFGKQAPRAFASPMQRYFLHEWYPDYPRRRTLSDPRDAFIRSIFFSHVNAACTKALWERFPFDESLVMGEDLQWSRHVLLAGYATVYTPAATVIHSHDYSLVSGFGRNFDTGAAFREVTVDRPRDWVRHGLPYVVSELDYLWRTRHAGYIPYALFYEAVRYFAFACGSHHRYIPRGIKARMSQHGYHWRKVKDPPMCNAPQAVRVPQHAERTASPWTVDDQAAGEVLTQTLADGGDVVPCSI